MSFIVVKSGTNHVTSGPELFMLNTAHVVYARCVGEPVNWVNGEHVYRVEFVMTDGKTVTMDGSADQIAAVSAKLSSAV